MKENIIKNALKSGLLKPTERMINSRDGLTIRKRPKSRSGKPTSDKYSAVIFLDKKYIGKKVVCIIYK